MAAVLRCGKCGTAGGSNTAGVGWRRWLVPPLPAVPHAVAFTLLLPFLLLCSDGVMDSLERFLLIATNSDDVTRAIDFAALDRVAAAARTQVQRLQGGHGADRCPGGRHGAGNQGHLAGGAA